MILLVLTVFHPLSGPEEMAVVGLPILFGCRGGGVGVKTLNECPSES